MSPHDSGEEVEMTGPVYMSSITGDIDSTGSGALTCYGSFNTSAALPLDCVP